MIRLGDLRDSFEGVIPSVIATLDDAGQPNISYLSHVHYVDDSHVALSNQYFSKTAANVRRHGVATLAVIDGRTGVQHILDLQFIRSEDHGEIFERISTHLDAASALQGTTGMMKLKAADIYRVTALRAVPPADPEAPPLPPMPRCDRLSRAARIAAAISAEDDADTILDVALDGLRDAMMFPHVVVLVPDADGEWLSTMASRGYDRYGTGAQVHFGEGLIGMAASTRRVMRLADLRRATTYVQAAAGETPAIPLPGLSRPKCQMAVPMLAKGQLRGVIFAESETNFAFGHEDEAALSLIAGQLAAALQLAELQAQAAAPAPPAPPVSTASGPPFRLRYYPFDDSVFIDDDYLIKGVPGRLLYHFLKGYVETGRTDYTNREIRREAALKLPDLKDNLETRLILLRRRLDDKAGPIRLTRPERGQIRLNLTGTPRIEVVTG